MIINTTPFLKSKITLSTWVYNQWPGGAGFNEHQILTNTIQLDGIIGPEIAL